MKSCGGEVKYPFTMKPDTLAGVDKINCFADCVNMQFESGPFLRDLGPIPEGAIPKKFVWNFGDALTEVPE